MYKVAFYRQKTTYVPDPRSDKPEHDAPDRVHDWEKLAQVEG